MPNPQLTKKEQDSISVRLRRADMVARVNLIQATLEHDVAIRLANSFDEFPIEVQMDAIEKAIPGTAVKGCYAGGEVYINLATVKSAEELEQTINEELYGHYGFHAMYGLENRSNMRALYHAIGGEEGFERLCQEHNVDLSAYQALTPALSREKRESILAEELMAHLGAIQTPTIQNRVQVLYGGLRQWWRENGFTRLPRYNNADIANLLHKANKAARQGPVQKSTSVGDVIVRVSDANKLTLDTQLASSDPLISAWTLLAQHDEAFVLGRSEEKKLETLVAELEGHRGLTIQRDDARALDLPLHFMPERAWVITDPNGAESLMYQRGDTVWIDVGQLNRDDMGKRIYNIAANYAFNNELKFIGDPSGLINVAITRRLENMVSSALKFGTTRHLAPHERQLEPTEDAPGLDWREGDDAHNIREMLIASYKATIKQVPQLENVGYNHKTGQFEDRSSGYAYTRADLYNAVSQLRVGYDERRARGEFRNERGFGSPFTAGRTTVERAIFTGTLLRGKSEENTELLAHLGHAWSERLNGILYSLSTDPEDWQQPTLTPQVPREWDLPVQQTAHSAAPILTEPTATSLTAHGRAQRALLDQSEALLKQSNEISQIRRSSTRSAQFNDHTEAAAPLSGAFTRTHSALLQEQIRNLRDNARAYRVAARLLDEHSIDALRPLVEQADEVAARSWFNQALGVDLPERAQALTVLRDALEAAQTPALALDEPAHSPTITEQPSGDVPLEDEVLAHLKAVNQAYEADDLDQAEKLDVQLEVLLKRIEVNLQEHQETLNPQAHETNDRRSQLDDLLAQLYLNQYSEYLGEPGITSNNLFMPRFDDEAEFVSALRETINVYGNSGAHQALTDEQVIDMARDAYQVRSSNLVFLRARLHQSALQNDRPTLRVADPRAPRPRPPMWVDQTLANEGALFQFAGNRALTANKVALAAAMQFANEGYEREAIRQKTGWFQGEDDKWRFEISDHQARIKADKMRFVGRNTYGFGGRLGDILDHPELFAAYPELANSLVDITIDPSQPQSGLSYAPSAENTTLGDIDVQAGTVEQAKEVLLHEIQHAIQYREQFSHGTNPGWLRESYIRSLQERQEKLNQRLVRTEAMTDASDRYAQEAILIEQELGHIDATLAMCEENDSQMESAFRTLYLDVYGEREARLTQERAGLTEEQRRELAPVNPALVRPRLVIEAQDDYQEIAAKMALSPVANVTLLPGRSILRLTQAADRSSFLHEGAHLFLDMEIKTSRGREPDQLQQKICDYLGVDSLQSVQRSEHEKFARGFEQYMSEAEAEKRAPQGIRGVFRTVKGWLQNTYSAVEDLGEPLSPAAKEMYAELMAGYVQPEPDNLYQAEKHERLIAMELKRTGFYLPGEAYTNAKLLTAYALAKAERDPEYPTVDRVFDRMNLHIERVTPQQVASDVRFDWDSFDLRATTRLAMAMDTEAAQRPAPELNNYDLSRVAHKHSEQQHAQLAQRGPAIAR